jgi:hypothetical protein
MKRRTLRLAVLSALLMTTLNCLAVLAAETPVFLQPNDPTFSGSDRSAIASAIAQLNAVLQEGYPVPTFRLADAGWTDRDFVVFVAGYLNSSGYTAVVVEGDDGNGDHQLWIFVKIPLDGKTAWVPVEAVPSIVGSSSRLGIIPWLGSSQTEFDPAYAAFSHVVELARRSAPTVQIIMVGYPLINNDTPFHASTASPQNIIAYVWTIEGDDEVYVETNAASFKYEFTEVRKTLVTLVVYDRWGTRGTATKMVDVTGEANCGCHPNP